MRRVVLAVVAAILVSGCGVRLQDEPQRVTRRDVPFGLLDQQRVAGSRVSFVIFFLRDDRVIAVPRTTLGPVTPEVVVNTILRGPTPEEAAAGLVSAIPPDTVLLAASRQQEVVMVNLSASFAAAEDLGAALRQLEAGVLELPGVQELQVSVEGQAAASSNPPG